MFRGVKFALKILVAVPVTLTFVALIRTYFVSTRRSKLAPCKADDSDYIHMNDNILKRFQDSIRFQTISYSLDNANYDEMAKYVNYLIQGYPVVHSSPLVTRHTIANYSSLYQVTGSDPSLTPYLFSTHIDVVPADPTDWITDPFSADIIDGFIYGRGTIDFKNGVNGIMEALEYALTNGFQPKRTFFVAMGHDEELNGIRGAAAIAEFMRNTLHVNKLEFVLDEGTQVLKEAFKGLDEPFAMVGVTEKGYANLELSVHEEPGHSSLFMGETSIGILARAISRLENTPFPSMFTIGSVDHHFIEGISQKAILPLRVVMSNFWLFRPLLTYIFSRRAATNALVRTVTVVTGFHAGVKHNVIPPDATAIINHRIHNAQTVQEVIDQDRRIIDDDRVKVKVLLKREPHPVAPYDDDSYGFQTVKASIQQIFPGIVVAPGVLPAATDSHAYLPFSTSIYRFALIVSYKVDLKRPHGLNERISITNYEQIINFYYHIMKNGDQPNLDYLRKRPTDSEL